MAAISYNITNTGNLAIDTLVFVFNTPAGVLVHANFSTIQAGQPSDFTGEDYTISGLALAVGQTTNFSVNYTYLSGTVGIYSGSITVTGLSNVGQNTKIIQTTINVSPLSPLITVVPTTGEYTITLPLPPPVPPCAPYQVEYFPWTTYLPDLDDPEDPYLSFYDDPELDGVNLNINLGGFYLSWLGTGVQFRLVNDGQIKVDVPYWYTTPAGQVVDLYSGTNVSQINNPVVINRYAQLNGTVLPTPGLNVYDGISTYSWSNSYVFARNFGEPIVCEMWYSLNAGRTSPLIGYGNYSFLGNWNPASMPHVKITTPGGYIKKYSAGIFRVGADMYNLLPEDYICGIEYTGTISAGNATLYINGVEQYDLSTYVSGKCVEIYIDLDPLAQGLVPEFGSAKSNLATLTAFFYKEDATHSDIIWPSSYLPSIVGLFNTYQVKYGWIIDTYTGGLEDNLIEWQPGMFTTVPNVVLQCAPDYPVPDYVPPDPIVLPCEPYKVSTYPWSTYFPIYDDRNIFYDDPTKDGVTLNLNLGGYYNSWIGSGTPFDFQTGVFTRLVNQTLDPMRIDGGWGYNSGFFYIDLWHGAGLFYISDPAVLSKYSQIGGSMDGSVNALPGLNQYPGVSTFSVLDAYFQAQNYSYPVIAEIWYSLNSNRTNQLIGYNNYTFIGDSYNGFDAALGNPLSYVKTYYGGFFKATADMYAPNTSDFIAGVSYVGGASGGTLKIIINGVVVQTTTAAGRVTRVKDYYTTEYGEDPAEFLRTGKSWIGEIEITVYTGDWTLSNTTYINQNYPYPDGTPNNGLVDTYQIKHAYMYDSYTGLSPGTQDTNPNTWIRWRPSMFYTLPNTELPCAPLGDVPDYTPPSPIT